MSKNPKSLKTKGKEKQASLSCVGVTQNPQKMRFRENDERKGIKSNQSKSNRNRSEIEIKEKKY